MKSRTVAEKQEADDYLVPGSFRITDQYDISATETKVTVSGTKKISN